MILKKINYIEILKLIEQVGNFAIKNQKLGKYNSFKKEDGTICTDIDIECSRMLSLGLKKICGNIQIISEEDGSIFSNTFVVEESCFVIDPIDGTSSFIKNKRFNINLCYCINSIPIISFIFDSKDSSVYFTKNSNIFLYKENKIKKYKLFTKTTKKISIIMSRKSIVAPEISNIADFFEKNNTEYQIELATASVKFIDFMNNKNSILYIHCNGSDWDILPGIPFLKIIKAHFFGENKVKILKLRTHIDFKQKIFIASYNSSLSNKIFDICFPKT